MICAASSWRRFEPRAVATTAKDIRVKNWITAAALALGLCNAAQADDALKAKLGAQPTVYDRVQLAVFAPPA